jgi:hypothetical protein
MYLFTEIARNRALYIIQFNEWQTWRRDLKEFVPSDFIRKPVRTGIMPEGLYTLVDI